MTSPRNISWNPQNLWMHSTCVATFKTGLLPHPSPRILHHTSNRSYARGLPSKLSRRATTLKLWSCTKDQSLGTMKRWSKRMSLRHTMSNALLVWRGQVSNWETFNEGSILLANYERHRCWWTLPLFAKIWNKPLKRRSYIKKQVFLRKLPFYSCSWRCSSRLHL